MTDQIPEDNIKIGNTIIPLIDEPKKCEYKDCNKPALKGVMIPLTNVKDSGVHLYFCEYHALIVIGGRFTARKEGDLFHMSGPTKEVQLIEQVMAARETVLKDNTIKKTTKSVDPDEFRKKDD